MGKGTNGCMGCLGILFVGACGAVALVSFIGRSPHQPSAPTENPATVSTPPPTVTTPNPLASTPSIPIAAPPRIIAPPPAPAATIGSLKQTAALARAALRSATTACMAKLQSSNDYQVAKADSTKKLKALEAMRAAGDMDGRLAVSSDAIQALRKVSEMEAQAVSADLKIKNASASVVLADKAVTNEESKIAAEAEAEKKDQAERTARLTETINNMPMNRAIREHRLIEGMTYNEAVRALGYPYSISKSGSCTIATWQTSRSEFWSAMLVDDAIISTSHTAL